MRETSCCLLLIIFKLMLFKHLTTSRYLDDLLDTDNPYFKQMISQIYPTSFQLNESISFDTEAPCLDLDLSITDDGIVSSKEFSIY